MVAFDSKNGCGSLAQSDFDSKVPAAMASLFYGAQNFEPRFFTGGPTRFYLPLLFDIVAQEKPALVVTLGLGDAQAHLAFCQAVAEQSLSSRCVAVRRAEPHEPASDDPAWQ